MKDSAEVVTQSAASAYPFYGHINDTTPKWDWDYMVASHNFVDYVESLYCLQEVGYRGVLTGDASPPRWDTVGFFDANARLTQRIWTVLHTLDRREFRACIRGGDFLKTWKFIETHILKL